MRGRDARRAEKAGERFSVSCESRILYNLLWGGTVPVDLELYMYDTPCCSERQPVHPAPPKCMRCLSRIFCSGLFSFLVRSHAPGPGPGPGLQVPVLGPALLGNSTLVQRPSPNGAPRRRHDGDAHARRR